MMKIMSSLLQTTSYSLLFLFTILLLLSSQISLSLSAATSPIEGIEMPDIRHVDGVTLHRNGHGVRRISFLGMDIKIYVAGFYSPSPLLSEEDVMTCIECPMQFDFTFLRDVSQGKITMAWQRQLDYSVTYRYDGYETDRDTFIRMFGPVVNYGTESVQLVGDDIIVLDQGIYKGRIYGRNFQRSFLSMWFGNKAVADDLKEGLLSGLSQKIYPLHNHPHPHPQDNSQQQSQNMEVAAQV